MEASCVRFAFREGWMKPALIVAWVLYFTRFIQSFDSSHFLVDFAPYATLYFRIKSVED
jgi:hypothetical protein